MADHPGTLSDCDELSPDELLTSLKEFTIAPLFMVFSFRFVYLADDAA